MLTNSSGSFCTVKLKRENCSLWKASGTKTDTPALEFSQVDLCSPVFYEISNAVIGTGPYIYVCQVSI